MRLFTICSVVLVSFCNRSGYADGHYVIDIQQDGEVRIAVPSSIIAYADSTGKDIQNYIRDHSALPQCLEAGFTNAVGYRTASYSGPISDQAFKAKWEFR